MSAERKRRKTPRHNPVTRAYLHYVRWLDQQREAKGWTHEQLCEKAGVGDGHFTRWPNPDTQGHGRVAVWSTLDRLYAALFPHGATLVAADILDQRALKAERTDGTPMCHDNAANGLTEHVSQASGHAGASRRSPSP